MTTVNKEHRHTVPNCHVYTCTYSHNSCHNSTEIAIPNTDHSHKQPGIYQGSMLQPHALYAVWHAKCYTYSKASKGELNGPMRNELITSHRVEIKNPSFTLPK